MQNYLGGLRMGYGNCFVGRLCGNGGAGFWRSHMEWNAVSKFICHALGLGGGAFPGFLMLVATTFIAFPLAGKHPPSGMSKITFAKSNWQRLFV